jgi:hypothetical protein
VESISKAPALDPYAVLRNRDLLLYLTGRFVASLGQQMLTVAVGGNCMNEPTRLWRWDWWA